ncbi:hypothetical protein, partial [Corallococcus exiguus]|uniref:hypothetical protein n=1 Tax=Corallococcus exiguus TaxID=83462 RepID=UPI001C259120
IGQRPRGFQSLIHQRLHALINRMRSVVVGVSCFIHATTLMPQHRANKAQYTGKHRSEMEA